MRSILPLAAFALLAGLLAYGLRLDPKKVPSPLIDKAAPEFLLPMLGRAEGQLSPADLHGQVWVLNVWASWCVACRAEHAFITELARRNLVNVIGLNYKDKPEDALRWLDQFGDPYAVSLMDNDGRVGLDWGVYGVPETFIIDTQGNIRYKHIGPINAESLQNKVLPIIQELLS